MRKTTVIGCIASALSILSVFVPFISFEIKLIGLSESYSLWEGAELQDDCEFVLFLLISQFMGGICAWLANKKHLFSIATLVVFAFVTMIACVKLSDLSYLQNAEVGLYLMMIAGLLGIVSSVLGFMKK